MTELEILERLAADTGLLAMKPTIEAMKQSAYEFTVRAAQALRDRGWALLKAPPGGEQVNGVRYQHLINKITLAIVDIIVNADDPNGQTRRPAWDLRGTGTPADVVEPPAAPPSPPFPPLPPGGEPGDPTDEALAILFTDVHVIRETVLEINASLKAIALAALEVRTRGIKFRL